MQFGRRIVYKKLCNNKCLTFASWHRISKCCMQLHLETLSLFTKKKFLTCTAYCIILCWIEASPTNETQPAWYHQWSIDMYVRWVIAAFWWNYELYSLWTINIFKWPYTVAKLHVFETLCKVSVSIPNCVTGIFHWHNPSGPTMVKVSTQPLREKSTCNIFWRVEVAVA